MNPVIECQRCGRRTRNQAGWLFWSDTEGIKWPFWLCPGCATPEEAAEADSKEVLNWSQAKLLWPTGIPNVYVDEDGTEFMIDFSTGKAEAV